MEEIGGSYLKILVQSSLLEKSLNYPIHNEKLRVCGIEQLGSMKQLKGSLEVALTRMTNLIERKEGEEKLDNSDTGVSVDGPTLFRLLDIPCPQRYFEGTFVEVKCYFQASNVLGNPEELTAEIFRWYLIPATTCLSASTTAVNVTGIPTPPQRNTSPVLESPGRFPHLGFSPILQLSHPRLPLDFFEAMISKGNEDKILRSSTTVRPCPLFVCKNIVLGSVLEDAQFLRSHVPSESSKQTQKIFMCYHHQSMWNEVSTDIFYFHNNIYPILFSWFRFQETDHRRARPEHRVDSMLRQLDQFPVDVTPSRVVNFSRDQEFENWGNTMKLEKTSTFVTWRLSPPPKPIPLEFQETGFRPHKNEEKLMRVAPYNKYHLVNKRTNLELHLAFGKKTLSLRAPLLCALVTLPPNVRALLPLKLVLKELKAKAAKGSP
ncbi:OLC1v1018892C1 [Oldenlandia corymbosa var. corymbosa]|uniref:OLC1v1018892C1 n=1 Tax=Oldenlandia corymbosa var. corymbosa TaxID=529605 RepID=A0AAV1ECN7_OLDCO|nr:OLC1v1018892C1 [Oldenlandia corymbosa var. corymbosa]